MSDNATRAAHAEAGLEAFIESCNEDDGMESNIIDLMVGLLHLCHREGIDTDQVLRCAEMHFEEETP
jgi:hypothetical protein